MLYGLNAFAGYSEIDQTAEYGDRAQYTVGATYAIGGATIGYQWSKMENPGVGSFYENDAYGVSFSVNDNLSISYAKQDSERHYEAGSKGTTLEADSIQVSYTVGGASIKVAEANVDNQNYVAGTNREGRTIALTLAF